MHRVPLRVHHKHKLLNTLFYFNGQQQQRFYHLPAASSRSLGMAAECGGLEAYAYASSWATPPELWRRMRFLHSETILGAVTGNDRVYERPTAGTFRTVQVWPSLRAALELLHQNYRNFDPQQVWLQ
jgi:hypothetical protein